LIIKGRSVSRSFSIIIDNTTLIDILHKKLHKQK